MLPNLATATSLTAPPSPAPHSAFGNPPSLFCNPQSPNLQSEISNLKSEIPDSHASHASHTSHTSHTSQIPHSAFRIPHSGNPHPPSLHTRGLALFSALMELVEIILTCIVDLLAGSPHLPNGKAIPLLGKAIQCLFSLTRLRLTLWRAPQRFTARQVLRLSRAFDKIRYLTGRAFDFSPWTSLTPDQLDQLVPKKSPSPSPSQSQSQSQSSGNPQSASATPAVPPTPSTPPAPSVLNVDEVPAATITATPGATLARVCENLVEIATELGLPHHPVNGFLPAQSPSPSQSQSPSSGNLQSTICNQQSPSVHPVHNIHSVHNVHSVHLTHTHTAHPIFPDPQASLSRAPLRPQSRAPG